MSSTNKDEADRCLLIAKNHYGTGNYSSAVKLAKKSISLYSTDNAIAFLKKAEKALSDQPSGKSTATSSTTNTTSRTTTTTTTSEEKKTHTPQQLKAVKAILDCGTDYYKVLSLDKKCTEVEIKKSYRKLALQFHPDKNSAPGADEAFKLISKAFTILSDPQKRVIHDAGGGDPEQRGNAGPGFSGFRTYQHPGFGGGGFGGEDVSPEDLFNMFFGQGGGGGVSGFPGFSSATFVGPGFRTHTFQTGGRRFPTQQPQQQQQRQSNGSRWAILLQLLPLLIFFGYSMISGLMTDTTPSFSFQPTSTYSHSRSTEMHNIPYYVNPKTFRATEQNKHKLARVEQQVVMDWVRGLQHECQAERKERTAKVRAASGVFGIGRDEKRYQEALSWPTRSCDQLTRIGYSKDY
ncbi:hypothetical protein BC941DRAFT_366908 [Chlamydoabsidia padenii]|nr:hypothetical protein BC941DRAFT_366908 [Chlamydoabsidia padenii]